MTMFQDFTLTNGPLRFSARAAGAGPTVLCLHGFPDALQSFDLLLAALASAGYRGVAVAMRGYEPQSQPRDGDYHAVRMAEDVSAWIDQLGDAPVHLVGHDWGATIAFATVGLVPEKIASLAVLAVPHPVRFAEAYATNPAQHERSHYIIEFQSPDADAGIVAGNCAWLERLWRSWSPGWNIPAAELAAMRATFAQPGVAGATLSWYRQAFDVVSAAGQATQSLFVEPIPVPTLGMVGGEDGCIGADVFEAAMQPRDFAAKLSVRRVVNAGHFLHRESPEAVNRQIVDWISDLHA